MAEAEDLSLVAHPGDLGGLARDLDAPRGPVWHQPGFRTRQIALVTTRLDPAVSRVADLAELYRQRWQVETSLAQLKTTMPMDVLHGKTVPGVLKELMVFAIVYNLVRMVMCPSAMRHHIGVERLSVLDALRWLGAPSTGSP